MTVGPSVRLKSSKLGAGLLIAAFAAVTSLAACGPPPRQHGYVLSENALEQVPIGSSREQVLLVLGTPSTTSALSGETFYYISQTVQTTPVMGRDLTDQRVLAVYFGEDGTVREIANYGLQDGKVFDFISRRTRTGGAEVSLIAQLLGAVGGGNPFAN
ncbi:MAG TPA: outer membrane protein assembly factor BamE [Methylomirabilota bacterium]|nr:outer membrane protein assembly factor BamE [Methylomirabilota bacterium]